MPDKLKHLNLRVEHINAEYFSPKRIRILPPEIPQRNARLHSQKLKDELIAIAARHGDEEIYTINFSGQDGKAFLFENLERKTDGMELLSVQENSEGKVLSANIRINSQKALQSLESMLDAYAEAAGTTVAKQLFASVEKIEDSNIRRLFTDDLSLFPADNEEHWWELWLTNNAIETLQFINLARRERLIVDETPFVFSSRTIFQCKATTEKLSDFIKKCNFVAEVRLAKRINEPIVNLGQTEQNIILDDIIAKTEFPNNDNIQIVVMDENDVAHQHPLLNRAFISNKKADNSLASNYSSHATEMAGLALFGDITKANNKDRIKLNHKIDSVQISAPDLEFGRGAKLTENAILLTQEYNNAYVMAITEMDGDKNKGKPSLWSACMDKIIFDYHKVIAISVGNIRQLFPKNEYKLRQAEECIESPAQSWNALSIGSYTEIANNDLILENYLRPYADAGDISPYSRTSCKFQKQWPIKPDVLFEGGNMVVSDQDPYVSKYDSLEPVSCARDYIEKPFTWINATSASTALAGQFIGDLMAEYPQYAPETIRGLIVHSAEWTDKMFETVPANKSKTEIAKLARIYGYGVPNLNKAKYSASSALTVIVEKEFQAYKTEIKVDAKGRKTKSRRFQILPVELPWPKELLEAIPQQIKLTITLSYFIEPNPSERSYSSKYAYQSHNLRFDIQRPDETPERFKKRINDYAVQANADDAIEEEQVDGLPNDFDSRWYYGKNSRKRGSIHKDTIEVTGAELASMKNIAIYSVGGWWKDKKSITDEQTRTKISLIISIDAGNVDVDLYNEIKNIIELTTAVPIEIPA